MIDIRRAKNGTPGIHGLRGSRSESRRSSGHWSTTTGPSVTLWLQR